MAKFKYLGTGERVFPNIKVIVKAGEEFEAPNDFVAIDCEKISDDKPSAPAVVPKKKKVTEIEEPQIEETVTEEITPSETDLPQESE